MDRKSFLQAFVPATLGVMLSQKTGASPPSYSRRSQAIPPYLQPGDTIAVTCPAGSVSNAELKSCLKVFENWGLNIKMGSTVGKKWMRYGGTDEERLKDLQAMLDDDKVNAIMFGRGGYGTMRIIDQVDWSGFSSTSKWLIGYSDITTIHLHVHRLFGIATLHGDMSTGLTTRPGDVSTKSLKDVLFGKPVAYAVKGHPRNREGNATGVLTGGNLTIIQACSGSGSDVDTDGKILFIEDVNEYKYSIDRMLVHLKRSCKLDKIAGLVVGGFTATKEKEEVAYPQSIEELILEKVKEYSYPVCFNFPAGHTRHNLALKLGVPYELSVSATDVILNEKQ